MTLPLSSIIIVTAPSGTGKTTLTRRLVRESQDLSFSVSVTTRSKREGENNGEHYWYVDEKTFKQYVEENRMVEWANVFGNLYGTTKDEIKRIHDRQQRALLEIDVQGAKSIREIYKDACAIFIMPPSIESLWERLRLRGTDSLEVRWRRLQTAGEELQAGKNFQHFIINEHLETAFSELYNLVEKGKPVSLSYEAGVHHCNELIKEFKNKWNSKQIPNSMQESKDHERKN